MRIVVVGATWHVGGYLIPGLVTDGGRRPSPRTKSHGRGPACGRLPGRYTSSERNDRSGGRAFRATSWVSEARGGFAPVPIVA